MWIRTQFPNRKGGSSRGIVANMLNCNIVLSEFELQLCYYIHFQTNTLRKGMNSLIIPTPSYGLYSTTTVLLQGWF